MCLTEIKRKQEATIVDILDADVRTQFIRFGLGKDSIITCLEKIPFGPLMIRHQRQEIAVGREVARKILIKGVR